MIFVVKGPEHPSPPLARSLSSVAKTIRRKERGIKRGGGGGGGAKEGRREAKGERIVRESGCSL